MGGDVVKANGPEIKRLRQAKAWSRKALAEFAEVAYKTIQRAEESSALLVNTLGDIAAALGVDAAVIMLPKPYAIAEPVLESANGTASTEITMHIQSFDSFVEERTRGFVGREFVFAELKRFIEDPAVQSGYFLVKGVPGIGKSALVAELVRRGVATVYHFNIAHQGINTVERFLQNTCAQLITRFHLPFEALPRDGCKDGSLLSTLLYSAAGTLSQNERLIIAVDALDEVDVHGRAAPANPLFLPSDLPDRVFFVLTTRLRHGLDIQSTNVKPFIIEQAAPENMCDIHMFAKAHVARAGIQRWMKQTGMNEEAFCETMWEKSEGNFMYLRHVFPAIARGDFADSKPEDLPLGLQAYYRCHWNQMRAFVRDSFDRLHRPVVCVIAACVDPISAEQLSDWTQLELWRVRDVINAWREFLVVVNNPESEPAYRLYHSEFRRFLQREVDPDLKQFKALILDALRCKLDPLVQPENDNNCLGDS